MANLVIREEDVASKLSKLKGNTSAILDNIRPCLFENVRDKVSLPLCIIFIKSLLEGNVLT